MVSVSDVGSLDFGSRGRTAVQWGVKSLEELPGGQRFSLELE